MAFIYKPDGFGGEEEKKNLSATLVQAAKLLQRLPDGSSMSSSSQTGPQDHKQWQSDRKVSQFTVRVAIPDREGGGGEGLALLNARQ